MTTNKLCIKAYHTAPEIPYFSGNFPSLSEKTTPFHDNKVSDTAYKDCIESGYLSIEKVSKMLRRLLIEKQMPQKKLIQYLGIDVKELRQLLSRKKPPRLVHKINLSLIKLYCSTNFNNQQEEKSNAIGKF
jgi:hypothetical protein